MQGDQALFAQIKFDVDDSSFDGGNGGNTGYFTAAASFFYVHSLTSDFKPGVTAGSKLMTTMLATAARWRADHTRRGHVDIAADFKSSGNSVRDLMGKLDSTAGAAM